MLCHRIVADALAENCYVVSGDGAAALVVDPGMGTAAHVARYLSDRGLTVGAVLLTHGHADHIWDAAEVAGEAPVYVPEPDAYRLQDPAGTLSAGLVALFPTAYRAPANVRHLPAELLVGGGAELLPGVAIRAVPAPGHTEGSTVYMVGGRFENVDGLFPAGDEFDALAPLVLTGDVIFRGSIGRTDLPGGDDEVMQWTLRTLAQALDPASMLLPGHGPATTMAHELATNPFLK